MLYSGQAQPINALAAFTGTRLRCFQLVFGFTDDFLVITVTHLKKTMTHNATVSNALLSKNEGMKTCHPTIHVTVYFYPIMLRKKRDDDERCAHKKGGCNPTLLLATCTY